LAGEQAIQAAKGPYLVVRTSWVYSAHGTNFLRTIARLAREKSELRIVADQIGAPTSARIIADAVVKILGHDFGPMSESSGQSGGILNVAADGHTSWYTFATRIVEGLKARGVGLKSRIIVPIVAKEYPTKANRPLNSKLDLTRAREVFGLKTPDWREALEPELDLLAAEMHGR
jgi:dTDP-4-dehydrorhamnose reductase